MNVYSRNFGEDETVIDVVKYGHFIVMKTAEILHMPLVLKFKI